MTRKTNTQMFALPAPPPERIVLGGARYALVRVFKHDFFAATCLYERVGGNGMPKVVVKLGRVQDFCGASMEWLGVFMRRHEQAIYAALAGVPGVPRWAGCLGPAAYAIEYIDALPLDHLPSPPPGFFERLRTIFDAVHARGVGYCDANKRSNILVTADGQPFLVDYQLSIRLREDLPWPLRQIARRMVSYVAAKDIYHLYKHKRRLSPQELTPAEDELSRARGGLHGLHRKIAKQWRTARRWFLHKQFEEGQLVSPTSNLEDHHQPEKETWRDRRD